MSVMQEQTGTSLSVDPHPTTPPAARGQYGRLVWGIALVVLVVDQGTKAWALSRLDPGVARPFIGDLITLQLVRNAGAAFSLFEGMTYLVTALAVGVVGWIFVLAHGRLASRAYGWCLGAVAGGALGNLGDRFFRDPGPGRGHVVDFLDYFGFFVGNVADIAIVLAALGILPLVHRGIHLDGTRDTHE